MNAGTITTAPKRIDFINLAKTLSTLMAHVCV